MSYFVWLNFVIVFLFGILWGVLELVINYELKYVGSFNRKYKRAKEEHDDVVLDKEESAVGYVFLYLLLNGFISALAFYSLKFFSKEPVCHLPSTRIC